MPRGISGFSLSVNPGSSTIIAERLGITPMHSALPAAPVSLHPNRRGAAFTLVETMVAMGICGFALSAFFVATGQAVHIVKSARETGCASELLQQRMERFRAANPWANLTSPSSVSSMVTAATEIGSSIPGATETFTISDYPADGNSFTVTRSSSGTITSSGAALPTTQRCVLVNSLVTWTGWSSLNRTRTLTSIITKGGVTP
jgi:type II secretory pathway pseudopilin PulG